LCSGCLNFHQLGLWDNPDREFKLWLKWGARFDTKFLELYEESIISKSLDCVVRKTISHFNTYKGTNMREERLVDALAMISVVWSRLKRASMAWMMLCFWIWFFY
jgi:hypothetical protein